MDGWIVSKLRSAPRRIAPAVLTLLAALVALRAGSLYSTGTTAYRGNLVDSTTVSTTGVTLTVVLVICAVLAFVALSLCLRGHSKATEILLVVVAILGIPAYLGPTVLAVIALVLIHRRGLASR